MRLIDADALIEAMGEEPYVWTDSAEEIAERNQWLTDMHIIESAPTIEIVRCKDCKYWQPHTQCGYDDENGVYNDYCGLLTPEDDFYAISMNADDFCSCGKRREP